MSHQENEACLDMTIEAGLRVAEDYAGYCFSG